jgi:hypothetical protein
MCIDLDALHKAVRADLATSSIAGDDSSKTKSCHCRDQGLSLRAASVAARYHLETGSSGSGSGEPAPPESGDNQNSNNPKNPLDETSSSDADDDLEARDALAMPTDREMSLDQEVIENLITRLQRADLEPIGNLAAYLGTALHRHVPRAEADRYMAIVKKHLANELRHRQVKDSDLAQKIDQHSRAGADLSRAPDGYGQQIHMAEMRRVLGMGPSQDAE